jgi:hypothetical protein
MQYDVHTMSSQKVSGIPLQPENEKYAFLWWGAQHVCSQVQQSGQVSVCSTITVSFELDVSVGHLAS